MFSFTLLSLQVLVSRGGLLTYGAVRLVQQQLCQLTGCCLVQPGRQVAAWKQVVGCWVAQQLAVWACG